MRQAARLHTLSFSPCCTCSHLYVGSRKNCHNHGSIIYPGDATLNVVQYSHPRLFYPDCTTSVAFTRPQPPQIRLLLLDSAPPYTASCCSVSPEIRPSTHLATRNMCAVWKRVLSDRSCRAAAHMPVRLCAFLCVRMLLVGQIPPAGAPTRNTSS